MKEAIELFNIADNYIYSQKRSKGDMWADVVASQFTDAQTMFEILRVSDKSFSLMKNINFTNYFFELISNPQFKYEYDFIARLVGEQMILKYLIEKLFETGEQMESLKRFIHLATNDKKIAEQAIRKTRPEAELQSKTKKELIEEILRLKEKK